MSFYHKLNTLIFLLLLSLFFVASKVSASTSVHSVSGSPLFTPDSLKVTTITKGLTSANDPFYKPVVQKIPNSLFIKTFKSSLALASNPYVLGLILAYEAYGYFYDDETGEISILENDVTGGTCNIPYQSGPNFVGITTKSNCLQMSENYWQPRGYSNVDFYYRNNTIMCRSYGCGSYSGGTSETFKKDIQDDDFLAVYQDYVISNPHLNHTDVLKNPDGSINQDYFPNPEFEYITVEDSVLMDLYGSGLLQSNDPSLDNYVTPEEFSRIKQLYDNANKTPQQISEELNAKIDQPITQAQYAEEQASKEARQLSSAETMSNVDVSSLDKSNELDEQFNILDNLITNPSDLPSLLPSMPQFNHSTSCQTIEIPSLFGPSVPFPNSSQCSRLNDAKEMIGYFLYILFAWMITTQLLKEAN